VEDERGRLATFEPISPYFTYRARHASPMRSYALSRFAFMRVEEGQTFLESPLAHARVVLHDWRAAALLQLLALPGCAVDAAANIPELSTESAVAVMSLLLNADMLGEADDSGVPATDRSPSLQSWEFHDLLFHTRSRPGRHDQPLGGTFRLAGKLDCPPALKPETPGKTIALSKPDLEELQRTDPSFTQVLERRCSVRDYGAQSLTVRQLGEFLYRVARVKSSSHHTLKTPAGPVRMDFAHRPFPAGGCLYEMEFYLAVNACEGLALGLYHYNPKHHRLDRVATQTREVTALLAGAGHATGIPPQNLQVLMIMAARFQRVAWKYSGLAYALMLKHVGIVQQTMYLAATAMNLAACAVGYGDPDLFARAAGTDYYGETSIGEFLLGSLPNHATKSSTAENARENGK
jgi:SagB-type dehydrogenase family enzyme